MKSESFKQLWDARCQALERVLGPALTEVFHAEPTFDQGGGADALVFQHWRPGEAYVTAEMSGRDVGQIPNSLGRYELMICGPERDTRLVGLMSRLASYTCKTMLDVGHTMSLRNYFGDGTLEALLFTTPQVEPLYFDLDGERYGLLLAIGITAEEMEFMQQTSAEELILLLTAAKVFPYTIPGRPSVWLPELE